MIKSIMYYLTRVGFWGMIAAIRAKITKSTISLTMNRKDTKFPFDLRIPTSDIEVYKQVFLDLEYNFSANPHPKTIIDAGANIGLTAIYFANKYPEAKIIALEPENSNYDLLKRNVEPYRNITPVHAALWNSNEIINLVDPGLGKYGFMTEDNEMSNGALGGLLNPVQAKTVDELIKEFRLEKIDILKIDIEGAEKEVFEDTSAWIEKIDTLIIELHDHMKAGCSRNFYAGSNGFDSEWRQGENLYLTREEKVTK